MGNREGWRCWCEGLSVAEQFPVRENASHTIAPASVGVVEQDSGLSSKHLAADVDSSRCGKMIIFQFLMCQTKAVK